MKPDVATRLSRLTQFPLTEAQHQWVEHMRSKCPQPSPDPSKATHPPCPFTDNEISWLWPRFQACSLPTGTFAKSFSKTHISKLTPKGKACLAPLAYRFRRQIIPDSAKLTLTTFIFEVKARAAFDDPPPPDDTPF